jgi:hypothetical protein
MADFQIFRRYGGLPAGIFGKFQVLVTYHRQPEAGEPARLGQKRSPECAGSDQPDRRNILALKKFFIVHGSPCGIKVQGFGVLSFKVQRRRRPEKRPVLSIKETNEHPPAMRRALDDCYRWSVYKLVNLTHNVSKALRAGRTSNKGNYINLNRGYKPLPHFFHSLFPYIQKILPKLNDFFGFLSISRRG